MRPEAAELLLSSLPDIRLVGLMRRSSNYTFLAELNGPERSEPLLAVYKPSAGESPLWDFPAGSLYRREVAAYRLARALGWPRVPPTVARDDAPHGAGSLQLFIEADLTRHYLESPGTPPSVWEEVALFDVITNNADRKSGHCLTDGEQAVWVIDHGLTFHAEPKLRTVIWEFAAMPLPDRLARSLRGAVRGLRAGGKLRGRLAGLIDEAELAALADRIDDVLRPGWRFPEPHSGWSLPWPPV